MTTNEILGLIDEINNNTHQDQIYLLPLGGNGLAARVWYEIEGRQGRQTYPNRMGLAFYFVKNEEDRVVAAVEDRNINDLHWVVSPAHCKKGYLTKALTGYILPYLFTVTDRSYQDVTVDQAEDQRTSRNVAIRAGCSALSECALRMTKDSVNTVSATLAQVDVSIDYQRTQELVRKANYAFNLLEAVADELVMAYNWSGSIK